MGGGLFTKNASAINMWDFPGVKAVADLVRCPYMTIMVTRLMPIDYIEIHITATIL